MLTLMVLAGCAGFAALVLYSATWPEVAALRGFYSYDWHPGAPTTNEWQPGLIPKPNSEACARPCSPWPGGGAAGQRAGLVGRGRQQLAALRRGVAGAGRGLGAGWQALTPGQRRGRGWLCSASRPCASTTASSFSPSMMRLPTSCLCASTCW
ncbi:hypothetical protein [Hymenobacter sp. BRD67]|uniref:hypothetical protein n=1 Tax=Hymenobacter sp. BRD67 TaxID=2675877 RepID=UPI0015672856|nr:hypothetical protein [Hymenobacter sp. BRD67]QKG52506.1 hypothetical protein GKZ67_07725 [Hymenobacter sp. BRD67]